MDGHDKLSWWVAITLGATQPTRHEEVRCNPPVDSIAPAFKTAERERTAMAHEITFIPGDGTGPELADATRRVLEATSVEFQWDEQPAGEDVYREEGTPFPDRTLESLKRTKVGIKGPTTTPVGSGFRSVNVLLRKELDLYSCIRPCKAYEGVRTRFPETDIVIVRENTKDPYAGIEYEVDSSEAKDLIAFLGRLDGSTGREPSGI